MSSTLLMFLGIAVAIASALLYLKHKNRRLAEENAKLTQANHQQAVQIAQQKEELKYATMREKNQQSVRTLSRDDVSEQLHANGWLRSND